jgi:acyl carrier protein
MAKATHVGKIVLTVDSTCPTFLRVVPRSAAREKKPARIRVDGAYIVTGGTSGVGLAIVEHLHRCGAGAVVAISRSGGTNEASAHLASLGPRVKTVRLDVATCTEAQLSEAVREVVGGMPVCGIVHGAMVLEDKLVTKMRWPQDLDVVIGPKIAGAWALARFFCRPPSELDWFVSLSSVNDSVGTQGQANYAAGNAFLDTLPAYFACRGVPAWTFALGPISDAGFVHRNDVVRGLLGVYGFGEATAGATVSAMFENAMRVSGRWMHLSPPIEAPIATGLGLFSVNWAVLSKAVPEMLSVGRLSTMVATVTAAEASTDASATEKGAACRYTIGGDPETAMRELVPRLRGIVSHVLSTPADQIDPKASLSTLGLDSLISVELRRELLEKLGAEVAIVDLVKGPSILGLAEYLAHKYCQSTPTAANATRTPSPVVASSSPSPKVNFVSPSPTPIASPSVANGGPSSPPRGIARLVVQRSEKEDDGAPATSVVFAFPCAGGNELAYSGWNAQLPSGCTWVTVVTPNLASHASTITAAVSAITQQLHEYYTASFTSQPPIVFFGHSLGCFIALQVAWRFTARA